MKALEIVYRANGAAVEGLDGSNVHRLKVVREGESVVGEVHRPKVRVVSANSPKRCSFALIC